MSKPSTIKYNFNRPDVPYDINDKSLKYKEDLVQLNSQSVGPLKWKWRGNVIIKFVLF